MGRQAWETVVAYKLVWLRALLLVLMPMAVLFDSYTEKWTQAQWEAITTWEWIRISVKMLITGGGAFIAFFDQSHGRAKESLERKRNGDTQFLGKDTGP